MEGKHRPNGKNLGVNVTAQFAKVLYVEYLLLWIFLGVQLFHLVSKFVKLDAFKWIVGCVDLAVQFMLYAWLIWATIIRFSTSGITCAGSSNNISSVVYPYSWAQGRGLLLSIGIGWSLPTALCIFRNCGCL